MGICDICSFCLTLLIIILFAWPTPVPELHSSLISVLNLTLLIFISEIVLIVLFLESMAGRFCVELKRKKDVFLMTMHGFFS